MNFEFLIRHQVFYFRKNIDKNSRFYNFLSNLHSSIFENWFKGTAIEKKYNGCISTLLKLRQDQISFFCSNRLRGVEFSRYAWPWRIFMTAGNTAKGICNKLALILCHTHWLYTAKVYIYLVNTHYINEGTLNGDIRSSKCCHALVYTI